jgi:geranylgeranyl pyrophosphate synthase
VDAGLVAWSTETLVQIERALSSRFAGAWPAPFQAAARYPLSTGGKRLRPLLCLAAAEAVSGSVASPAQVLVAASLELIHTYSLVHDDLPSMDDDNMRRGKPTVHVVYGEGPAVLVGDALLTDAFSALTEADLPASVVVLLVRELALAAGHVGMIGGQAADVGMGGPARTVDDVLAVHRGKTGALIRGAVRMGALAGGADAQQLAALTTYGEAVGLAFQLADDLLDAEQDAGPDGPPSVLRLLGEAETRAWAHRLAQDAEEAVAHLNRPAHLVALARWSVHRDH